MPSLPVEIWNIIFSHFVTGPIRLQVKLWYGGRFKLTGDQTHQNHDRDTITRFLAAFVTPNSYITGFHHAAIRFLMVHTQTVWIIETPFRLDCSSRIWPKTHMSIDYVQAIEHLAMLEDVFKLPVRAVKVIPVPLGWTKDFHYTNVKLDSDRFVLMAIIRRFANIRAIEYSLSPSRRSTLDSKFPFDLKQMATQGHPDLQKLKHVKCHTRLCSPLHKLPIKLELEDDLGGEVPNAVSFVLAKQSKRRLITSLCCMHCGLALSG